MKTLVLANQKGGVGKSAVATLLAHQLSQRGLRVLAIDFDHQGNFSAPLLLSKRVTPMAAGADQILTTGCPAVPEARFVLATGSKALADLERQPALHNDFASRLRTFLRAVDTRFDACVIDTNPNPDVRVIAAMVGADFVLSPIQLSQEAMDGVGALLNHHRAGFRRIKLVLNPKVRMIGLLPTLLEATPFQKANLRQLVERYYPMLIRFGPAGDRFVIVPKRAAIAEAQAEGAVLWEMKKSAARDAWREIEPGLAHICDIVTGKVELEREGTGDDTQTR